MKRALLVGVDRYVNFTSLLGCVNDVKALVPLLARNEDDSPNFECQARTSDVDQIDRRHLIEGVDLLLAPGADVALFYFAGHGYAAQHDVMLATQDGDKREAGVALSTILAKIGSSSVREAILVLDCCFSGSAGAIPQLASDIAALRSGVSILSASRGDQPAAEKGARGLFSTYFCGALEGGAADVVGKVTVAGVYAYLSECFGAWDQRPTFKAHVDRLHELRRCAPAVPLSELRQLHRIFSSAEVTLPLDPSYEPTVEPRDLKHEGDFGILQKCRAAKLVEPVGAEHLYFAAMESQGCRLTPLGRLYWTLASQNRL
jgi:hypothetical protein